MKRPAQESADEIPEVSRRTISVRRKHELEEEERKLSNLYIFNQLLNFNGNLSHFRNEDYDQQTSWFFYFIDIIYVATIFNISHLITKCGEDTKVYVMAASYFSIMFSTRMFFDTFTSILQANGVLHTLIFILYGMGVYVMTLNIATVTDSVPLSEVCQIFIEFDDAYISVDDIYLSDTSSVSDLTAMAALRKGNITSGDHQFGKCHQVEHYDFGFAVSFLFTRCLIFLLFFLYCTVFTKVHVRPAAEHDSLEWSASTSSSSRRRSQSTSLLAEPAHDAHTKKVFVWKIFPLILSSCVMLLTFGNYPTVIIFPLVALIEFFGDILPEMLVTMEGLKPNRHNLEERLGLMFMLVLGENMLGFLVQRGNAVIELKTYATVIPAYILVIAIGMQYFKNAQFPYLEGGKHPLDRPGFSACYIWLNGLLSFLMLVAANGLVEVYNDISDLGGRSNSSEEQVQKRKISVGLFGVWVILLTLHLLEGTYWDVIVTSLWGMFCGHSSSSSSSGGVGGGGGDIEGVSGKGISGGVTGDNKGGGTVKDIADIVDTEKNNATAPTDGQETKDSEIHSIPLYSAGRESKTFSHTSVEIPTGGGGASPLRQSLVGERDSFRRSSITRRSLFFTPAQIEQQVSDPPVFNKRLFFLKIGVAIIHLAMFRFHIDSQYFVVVTAVVALLPQFLEVVLEFIDWHTRMGQIRKELLLPTEKF